MLDDLDYTVTGLLASEPKHTHLQYSALMSWASTVPGNGALDYAWLNNWLTQANYTFLLMAPGADVAALEAKFGDFMQRNFETHVDRYELFLQPLTDIYLRSNGLLNSRKVYQGNMAYVYVFSAVAVLILLIACINFMNLSTARATLRSVTLGLDTSLRRRLWINGRRRRSPWQCRIR